jgi:multidrug resistance efflux pump
MKRLRAPRTWIPRVVAAGFLATHALAITGCDNGTASTTPIRRDVVESVFTTGALFMADGYVVATNQEGFVDSVFVEIGENIEVGTPLFRLTSPVTSSQLATARAEYEDALRKADPKSPSIASLESQIDQATRQHDLERKNLRRYAKLLETGATSQVEYDGAALRRDAAQSDLEVLEQSLADLRESLRLGVETAQNQLRIAESQHDDTLIHAAHAGLVLDVFKEQGELAHKGETLGRIGSGDFVAELLVAEEDIGQVRLGQDVSLRLNTRPDRVIDAVLTAIHPSFDVVEQSFRVEASFAQQNMILYAGTQLQADIIVARRTDVLTIPVECLVADSLVTLEDGQVVSVTPVSRAGRWVEIQADLSAFDRILIVR